MQTLQRKVPSLRVIGGSVGDGRGPSQKQQLGPVPAQLQLPTLEPSPQETERSDRGAGDAVPTGILSENRHKVPSNSPESVEFPSNDPAVKEIESEPPLASPRLLRIPNRGEIILDSEDEGGSVCCSRSKLSLRNYHRTRFNTFIPTFQEHFRRIGCKTSSSWRAGAREPGESFERLLHH
ncbi:uncharacterized protein LOC115078033 isoform X2 [Rhinatrema bivittatum]|uniref:uncharacterized protein LOC115078033 isoform X2 n=1 Tax=Rhinatrema bivittatum TaxID=194408 RepID=UPI00112B0052|nr:uncharacterized protein LOC115078033 isoform X2 [Rhinatrema bivittatum]